MIYATWLLKTMTFGFRFKNHQYVGGNKQMSIFANIIKNEHKS